MSKKHQLTSATVAILLVFVSVRVVAQQKDQSPLTPAAAWVLWSYTETSTLTGYEKGWEVLDAFEDFKTCKAAALKVIRSRAETDLRMKEVITDLNAGGLIKRTNKEPPYKTFIYKSICLPAGTNPGVVREEAVKK